MKNTISKDGIQETRIRIYFAIQQLSPHEVDTRKKEMEILPQN